MTATITFSNGSSLAGCFITGDGRDLIDVLRLAFHDAEELRHCIEIVS